MSSDEDYMSEEFLTKCLAEKNSTPGLIQGHAAKRKHEMYKKKENESKKVKPVSVASLEMNRREEGLQSSIESNNKGFAMLQKMGYQPGKGIGKEKSGRAEPVPIVVKNNRLGLGRESLLKEIMELKMKKRKERLQNAESSTSLEDFRKRIASKNLSISINRDLCTSQRICRTLDIENNISEPDEKWFWPEEPKDDEDEEDDDDVYLEPWEKLKYLTSYLNQCYYYCIWCGVTYENCEDMSSNCPGPTKDDH